ncbi:MAG: hypothetical protein J4400_00825, partial [Candidatus Aenigmarchaeota archaeon]|nr:hypothetical protein [Candidatus Aenigmarchaeota archaeon]
MYKDTVKFLGNFGTRHFSGPLKPLREEIVKSNLSILFELYVGRMLLLTILSFLVTFSFIFIMFTFIGAPLIMGLIGAFVTAFATSFIVLTIYHSYPFHLLTSKKNSIDGNLPFAINHMAAISA